MTEVKYIFHLILNLFNRFCLNMKSHRIYIHQSIIFSLVYYSQFLSSSLKHSIYEFVMNNSVPEDEANYIDITMDLIISYSLIG